MFALSLLHGVAAALGLCATGGPAAVRPEATPGQIEALVRQLDSRAHGERERASRTLEALGGPALDALRKARGSTSAEVRRRAETLVRRVERRLDAERVLTPRTVRLAYRDTPLPDAVADLAKRTGFAIRLEGDAGRFAARKVTLETGEVPLWDALALLCAKAGLREVQPLVAPPPVPRGGMSVTIGGGGLQPAAKDILNPPAPDRQRGILLGDGEPSPLPVLRVGSARLRVLPGDTPFAGERLPGDRVAGLVAEVEPALRWHEVLAVRIDRAVDDRGQAVMGRFVPARPAPSPQRGMVIVNGVVINGDDDRSVGDAGAIPLVFRPAAKPSATLAELKGVVAAQVQTAPEDLVAVEDVLRAAGKRFDGAHGGEVRVAAVTRHDDGRVELRVEVAPPARGTSDGSTPPKPNLNIIINGRRLGEPDETLTAGNFALLDRAGRPLEAVRAVSTGKFTGALREYELTYRPAGGAGEAFRFVYRDRRTVAVEIPFTFRGVPLR